MKKYMKWIIIFFIALFLIGFACAAIGSCIESQKKNTDNDAYVNYICRDAQLVCIDKGDWLGWHIIDVGTSGFNFYYRNIDDFSEGEFVSAKIEPRYFFPYQKDIVLQSPENKINVLQDWTIKKLELYYFDENEFANSQKEGIVTKDEMVTHSIANVSDDKLIAELKDVWTHIDNTDDFRNDKLGTMYNSEDVFSEADELIELYIRAYFEESESLAWDSEIRIYRAKEEHEKDAIVLCQKKYDEEYESELFLVELDSSSELYQFIYNAYIESNLGSVK